MAGMRTGKHEKPQARNWYLKYAKAEHFGDFSQRTLGPLGPHLNVVYGGNEAGKTSFVNLISGVMFGWEDGRVAQNTYKPVNAERCGSLTFEREAPVQAQGMRAASAVHDDRPYAEAEVAQISRTRNAEGLKGDTWLVDDIDKGTYQEAFNLNSEKLLTMNDASRVTSRLLTASSGTTNAPTKARDELGSRISEYTSKSEKYPHSIVRLQRQRADLQERIKELTEGDRELVEDSKRLEALVAQHKKDQAELAEVSGRIERLAAFDEAMRPVDALYAKLMAEREQQANRQLPGFESEDFSDVPSSLLRITNTEDVSLRKKVKALEALLGESRMKLHEAGDRLDDAEEAFLEAKRSSERSSSAAQGGKQELRQVALYGGIAVAFAALGLVFMLFLRGQGSMGGSALTLALFVCAAVFLLLCVVRFGMYARRRKAARDDVEDRRARKECERRVKKERADFDRAQKDHDALKESVYDALDDMGLGAAHGSTAEALNLLDRARNARLQGRLEEQVEEVAKDIAFYEDELARCDEQRQAIIEQCGLDGVDEEAVRSAWEEASRRRDTLTVAIEETNREIGRLEQKLQASASGHALDALRLECQQVDTKIGESMGQLARLLIAKKAIDDAIGQWKKTSQPEVVSAAARILNELTHGAWTGIHMKDSGDVEVSDRYGTHRPTRLLSTATCQQVYISLRLALLETAFFVGRNVPVMCDDMLVHFDWSRRAETARFLARLAQSRQVIVFTCHEQIVELLLRVDPDCTVIEL